MAEVKTVSAKSVTKEILLEQYSDVFSGLGKIPGEYEIQVDKDIQPVQHRPRRTPILIKDDVIAKLKELEQAGVVSRVDEPTPWTSSLVAVRKSNGKIRICIDPRDLNKAIIRNKYPIPTIEEVLPRLEKAKCFSLLDAKDGFLQMRLSENTRKLTTFWTPLGRYCWNRMPFGLSSSPEEFQRRLHQALDGLDGIEVIADDILVYGCGNSQQEGVENHDKNLLALMDRLQKTGIKMNKDKLKLHVANHKHIGHILTPNGVKPDPDKISGIRDMPYPEDKKAVKRFVGMVMYLEKFIPKLSQICEPLTALLKDAVDFRMTEKEKRAVDCIKETISLDAELRYFDSTKPAVIQCDASYSGLGAVLLQDGKPVSFVSRTLTGAECRYHPLELECLAVVFACSKFDQYIYGKRDITVLSDHQPLETIFKKTMDKSPLRLKKMLLTLQRYGFYIEYQPGTQQVLADALSRAPIDDRYSIGESKVEIFCNSIDGTNASEYTDMTDVRLERIKRYTSADETMKSLIKAIHEGWPEKRKDSGKLENYWTIKEELGEQGGLVYKGTRLIIPREGVREVCEALHAAHQGAETMLRRARDILYWPRMGEDIQQMADRCKICVLNSPANAKEPLVSHMTPKRPFTKVASDIFYLKGLPYVVVVDYTTDYIEVEQIPDETAQSVIEACKRIFARHGRPLVVHSDNGPQYSSAEFSRFAMDWNFEHTTSSPYHPRSNGKAESAVKIVKNILKTAADPWRALMEWRGTPNRDFSSPNERLFGRKVRTFVPVNDYQLRHDPPDMEKLAYKRASRQKRMQSGADRELDTLRIGQPVVLRTVGDRINKWREGKIIQPLSDRSYLVESDGNVFRRNRVMLREDNSARVGFNSNNNTHLASNTSRSNTQQSSSISREENTESSQDDMHQQRPSSDIPSTPRVNCYTRSGRASRRPIPLVRDYE